MCVVVFLASEYQTMNFFLCVNDKAFSFWVSLVPSALRGEIGISTSRFSVSGSRTIVTTPSLYTCMAASVRIDNDVLNPISVPNCAAPRVAIYRHHDRNFSLAPDLSCVEWQRERGSCVVTRLIAV